jgi:hypothetical protein
MSSIKPTKNGPESRKKRFSRGLRELFSRKKESQHLPSSSSQQYADSETQSIQKHDHNPSITIEHESSLSPSEPVDVGALPYAPGLLHVTSAQSQHSLASHKSGTSFTSKRADAQNE